MTRNASAVVLSILLAAGVVVAREATRFETFVETRADRVSSAIEWRPTWVVGVVGEFFPHAYPTPGGFVCDQADRDGCVQGCKARTTDLDIGGSYLIDAECSWSCELSGGGIWTPPIFRCEKSCRCVRLGTEALMRLR